MKVCTVLLSAVPVLCLLVAPVAMAAPTALTGSEPNTVVLYNFDEFAGDGSSIADNSSMLDSSPNHINGRNYNSTYTHQNVDLGTGFGNAVRVTSRVGTLASDVSADLLKGNFTLEMWVRNGSGALMDANGVVKTSVRMFSARKDTTLSTGVGWLLGIAKVNGQNSLQVAEVAGGGLHDVPGASGFVLPTSTWTHWAASFVNTNPGDDDIKYRVSLYVSAQDATVPNLVATFDFDPAKTATELAGAYPLSFNGDTQAAFVSSVAAGADLVDGCRLSNVARTSFETLPEPATLSLLVLAGMGLLRRRR